MKDRNAHMERQVRMTLDLLDDPEVLLPRPGLYERTQHRVQAQSTLQSVGRWHVKPVLIALLVALDLFVAYRFLAGAPTTSSDTRSELMELLSGDLNIDGTDIHSRR
jgi:hypothetical protein